MWFSDNMTFILAAVLVVMAIFLMRGHSMFLIAGYNMLGDKERDMIDKEKLGKFMGRLLLVFAAAMVVMGLGVRLNIPILTTVSTVIVVTATLAAVIYGYTGKRFLKEDAEADAYRAKWNVKDMNVGIKYAAMVLTATLAIVGTILYFGEREPTITVGYATVHIDGMYGITIDLVDIVAIEMIDETMVSIGTGMRRGGYGGLTGTLKGSFDAGLLFVDSRQAPTIRLQRWLDTDVFISFSNPQATLALYYELRNAR